MTTRILVVDNYDSFVWTIAGYLAQLGADCDVLRNDAVSTGDADGYDGVLLSPGPGVPAEAGVTPDMVRHCADTEQPLLGVCLGHQALGEVFGGTVAHAPELMHGKTSQVEHEGAGVLQGLPSPFTATRYHSLTVLPETVPDELEVTGRTASGVVMGLQHRELPLFGVQFHPESVLTPDGKQLLRNFLADA
jgi:para-aminobenzoate synthetase component II